MLYFMLTQLCNVQHFYQYSLDSFLLYFARAVHRATANPDITARVKLLQASLRLTIFTWVARGLFEQHKLLFLTQLTFSLIKRGKIEDLSISPQYYDFLMRCPRKPGDEKPEQLAWLPDSAYASVMSLCDCEDFSGFGGDLGLVLLVRELGRGHRARARCRKIGRAHV